VFYKTANQQLVALGPDIVPKTGGGNFHAKARHDNQGSPTMSALLSPMKRKCAVSQGAQRTG
jgi:hypothetical protein